MRVLFLLLLLQAGRGLAGITWIPTVAVDILELLAANNGDNVFTKQMTTAIRQVSVQAGSVVMLKSDEPLCSGSQHVTCCIAAVSFAISTAGHLSHSGCPDTCMRASVLTVIVSSAE